MYPIKSVKVCSENRDEFRVPDCNIGPSLGTCDAKACCGSWEMIEGLEECARQQCLDANGDMKSKFVGVGMFSTPYIHFCVNFFYVLFH